MNQIIKELDEDKKYIKKIEKFTSKRLNKFIDLIVEAYNEGFADGISYEDE